jgi:hypothetical protein
LAPSGSIFEKNGNRCSELYAVTFFGKVADIGGMADLRYSSSYWKEYPVPGCCSERIPAFISLK